MTECMDYIQIFPTRYIDTRLLPSLVPEDVRNETAQAIVPELQARINKLKGLIDAGVIDSDSSGNGIYRVRLKDARDSTIL